MKRNILSIIALFFAFASIQAGPITGNQAAKNARIFLNGNSLKKFAGATLKMATPDNGIQPYYVFNIGEDMGFVIVSGDDAAYPILGYSRNGHFDASNIPDNMRTWLDGYAHDLSLIQKRNLPARADRKTASEGWVNIPKLITSEWNQGHPYNKQCPKYDGDVENRPTGCVATAMAQVMYFHKWPVEQTSAINGYSFIELPTDGSDFITRTEPALEPTMFDWDVMTDKYDSYSDVKSEDEVAKLMKYVGHSVEMEYGDKMSGAYSENIPNAMINVFGYKNTAKIVYPGNYNSREEWNEAMYNELMENRPILYAGSTKDGAGHQFICDGYENGFFHINWGWGGMSDGFFKLEVLDPYEQGTGGAGTGMAFSEYQSAVIGVQKPVEDDNLSVADITAQAGDEMQIDVVLNNERKNYTSMQFDMTLPEGINVAKDDAGMPKVIFNDMRSENKDHKVSVNKLSDGVYRFIAYSPSNASITEKEGKIISITAEIASDMNAGTYKTDIKNVVMCNNNMKEVIINGCEFKINVLEKSYSLGDVNKDDKIDNGDVDAIVGSIMNKNPEPFDATLADIDGDGVIDINDVMMVKDIILENMGAERHVIATEMDYNDAFSLSLTEDGLDLALKNNTLYKAIQMDYIVPEGIDIISIIPADDRINGFNIEYEIISDCRYRILIFASDNRNIALNDGMIVRIVNNDIYSDAKVTDIIMVTSDLNKMKLEDVEYNVPTGIDTIDSRVEGKNVIYTLEGTRVNNNVDKLAKGVYIINGKKIVIK